MVKVELNSEGVRSLLKSGEMAAICRSHAQAIANRAGPGYGVSSYVGRNRVNASAYTATREAEEDNKKNNTLLKAVK